MKNLTLNICHLYPRSMNIYGDYGNVIALIKRCQWRGISIKIFEVEVGNKFDGKKYDLIFAGGGQDQSQLRIADDLKSKKFAIKQAIEDNKVFIIICGTYQLFGHYFTTHENKYIRGISVFDMKTIASNIRKIGNVKIKCHPEFISGSQSLKPSTLVGFENHSGNTFITKIKDQNSKIKTIPLGQIIKGFGNNGEDQTEGAVYKNCFGTYLHGSLLPKNPHFTDYLIKIALENKYQTKIKLQPLNDELEIKAHNFILKNR